MDFDRSRVSALQENEGLRVARWTGQVQAGYVMVRNARRAFGLPVEARGRRFLAAPQFVVESGLSGWPLPRQRRHWQW